MFGGKLGGVHHHLALYERLQEVEKDLEQQALDAWEAGYIPVFEAHLPVTSTIVVVGMEALDRWQLLVCQKELH
jgi:hypothetical protein